MKHLSSLVVVCVFAACGGGSSAPAGLSKVEGTGTVGGKPVTITGCKVEALRDPSRPGTVFTFDNGMRFRDDGYDGPRISRANGAWEKPDCDQIMSHVDSDGTTYAKGEAGATCKTPDGELVFKATFECGVPPTGAKKSNRKD
jgi:hypothetical protein